MKVAIAGAGGRMGRTLIDAVLADPGLTLAAAFDMPGSPAINQAFGNLRVGSDAGAAAQAADVLIDFTRPEGTLAHLKHAKAIVIGTTGFTETDRLKIVEAAKRIPIAMAANFAVGVNAAYKLAEMAAKILGEGYDVEIIEAHHRHKVDAPSGTALKLGEVAAAARGRTLDRDGVFSRHGVTGERKAGSIGFSVARGGDMVGDHTVYFAGPGERVEITHRASSRNTYAQGAMRAAKFLLGRAPGLYDMQDVLRLKSP